MTNNVKTVSDREFTVNGKPVYLDNNDKWVAKHLNASELQTAFNHIRGSETLNNQS